MAAITMSPATKSERDRVERMFVRYQELRDVDETWPRVGPSIGKYSFDCCIIPLNLYRSQILCCSCRGLHGVHERARGCGAWLA